MARLKTSTDATHFYPIYVPSGTCRLSGGAVTNIDSYMGCRYAIKPDTKSGDEFKSIMRLILQQLRGKCNSFTILIGSENDVTFTTRLSYEVASFLYLNNWLLVNPNVYSNRRTPIKEISIINYSDDMMAQILLKTIAAKTPRRVKSLLEQAQKNMIKHLRDIKNCSSHDIGISA